MKPRITLNLTEQGELEIWLNPEGRDLLVGELQALDESNDHVHLSPDDWSEIEVSSRGYNPTDKVIQYGKILFRTDAWDHEYFPHVMTVND